MSDDADDMCPNCQTPWKCNGPHLSDQTPYATSGRLARDVAISVALDALVEAALAWRPTRNYFDQVAYPNDRTLLAAIDAYREATK